MIRIDAETDRVYCTDGGDIIIKDESFNRNIRIACEGSKTAVVWNPWSRVCGEKSDLASEDYKKMICIETANAGDEIIVVSSLQSHTIKAIYSIE